MAYRKKNKKKDYQPFLIEDDFESPLQEVNMSDILYRLIYITSLEYGQKRYDRFKSFVESLQAVLFPILPNHYEDDLKKWSSEIDKEVNAKAQENIKEAKALRDNLEIEYYYKVWKKLLMELRKQGYCYVQAITLPA